MNYYKFYFNITENGRQHTITVDADNPRSAYITIRKQHPRAQTITFISGGKKNHIEY